MDKIVIKNLNIFAYHGVFEEEKKNGQLFRISAELRLSLRKAAQQDDLRLAVNYADVCELIQEVTTREKCDLIETVAENIAAEILMKYSGYISRERLIADKMKRLEDIRIKGRFDYSTLQSLSTECRQKLIKHDPETLAEASRIPGVSPSDINVLLVLLNR